MRALIQHSGESEVIINGKEKRSIKSGLVIFLGITHKDTEKDVEYLINKIVNLRLFKDENEKHFEKSLIEVNKEALIVSQFTLYAKCKKGRRPDFIQAAKPETAIPLYEKFIDKLREKDVKVETGVFGAMMEVKITNQGPITIILDSNE
jgi:D-aminoacyl-tRNA deacylase